MEYYEWQCSHYKALQYVDYLYKEDGNFTKMSLESCFEKYLRDLPEFKLAEDFCAKAKKLRAEEAISMRSIGKGLGVGALSMIAIILSLI